MKLIPNIAALNELAEFNYKSSAKLIVSPFFLTIFSHSNAFIQYYSIGMTLLLADLFVVGVWNQLTIANLTKSALYLRLFAINAVVLAFVGVFLMPASGKIAEFLYWHAIIVTSLIIVAIIAGIIAGMKGWNLFWLYLAGIILDMLLIVYIWLHTDKASIPR